MMRKGLTVLEPVVITDAMLISSDVPETDEALWSSATAYTAGQRVRRPNHRIYQALASTTNETPEVTPTKWGEVGPVNRWRVFDRKYIASTTQATSMSYTLEPGRVVNGLGVVGLTASSVRCRMVDPTDGTVYDRTINTSGVIPSADWYDYFFADVDPDSVALFLDLPTYGSAQVIIDIVGDQAQAGAILLGYFRQFGLGVEYGATWELNDFSIKEQNDFGTFELVERGTSDLITLPMKIHKNEFKGMRDTFRRLRTTPCLYIGSSLREETIAYGIFRGFGVSIDYPMYNETEIVIMGILQK